MLHDIEEGDSEDDEGHQFYGLGPASLAPLAQANGEDDHRDGEDKYKQRGHSLETTSTSALAHWIVGAATHQDRRDRARQQARQDHNRSNLPR